ncbi:hypothetical protein KKF84_17185 [Myxococcota bacterium]|nr:hypothetical protein [Myxococcota bacterium]MBU1537062.1 hypothetical protein [Myxococcota bacterium]
MKTVKVLMTAATVMVFGLWGCGTDGTAARESARGTGVGSRENTDVQVARDWAGHGRGRGYGRQHLNRGRGYGRGMGYGRGNGRGYGRGGGHGMGQGRGMGYGRGNGRGYGRGGGHGMGRGYGYHHNGPGRFGKGNHRACDGKGKGASYVDANKNGVCDHFEKGKGCQGDPKADGRGKGRFFTDKNKDGVCDHYSAPKSVPSAVASKPGAAKLSPAKKKIPAAK